MGRDEHCDLVLFGRGLQAIVDAIGFEFFCAQQGSELDRLSCVGKLKHTRMIAKSFSADMENFKFYRMSLA